MKKLLVIMVLMMGSVALNAQRIPIKVADLPKTLSDTISKQYEGYSIKEVTKVVENNVTTFELVIAKGSDQQTLIYDNSWKFLKKQESKTDIFKEPV